MKISRKVRTDLWDRDFGKPKPGVCAACHGEITVWNFEAGHIIPKSKGGSNHIDNLRPICGPCNKSMGTRNMDDYINEYYKKSIPNVNYIYTADTPVEWVIFGVVIGIGITILLKN